MDHRRRSKNLRRIHRVKAVLLAAKFAANLDLPLLGQDAVHFFYTQAVQHATDALAAATAVKTRAAVALLRPKAQQRLFPKQAAQNVSTSSVSSSSRVRLAAKVAMRL